MTRPAAAAERGFTLIEVLVALALMGMAAVLLLQGLQLSAVIERREQADRGRLDEVIATQRLLRSVIGRLRPLTRLDTAQPIVDARGTADYFVLVSAPLDRAAPDTLQRYRIERARGGELVLYTASLRTARFDRNGVDLAGWTPIPLIDGVRGLSIDYFGPTGRGNERLWQARWADRPAPPELVRIRLDFVPGSRRVWPDLVIRPGAAGDVSCQRDPVMGGCRAPAT